MIIYTNVYSFERSLRRNSKMPTRLLNQPDDVQLATLLKELLRRPGVLRFDALVAFAVSSGVQELQQELEGLLARGGHVRVVVGVSNRVTTAEGLELLLESAKKGAQVFVFHNDNAANPIFHPKLYLCQEKYRAFLTVGSNNMTGKGLVGNYEISLMEELDLRQQPDAELVAATERIVETYCDVASGFSHALDEAFLQELQAEGYLGSEKAGANRSETSAESDAAIDTTTPKKKLFASKVVPQATSRKGAAKPAVAVPVPAAGRAAPAAANRGPLVWTKKLTLTDAQRQPGNVTGEVRLTQANWKINGKVIDQTTYFRNDVFGRFNWRKTKARSYSREETGVQFHIKVLGNNIGIHRLLVSDKPSGEANQGNYTSALHWGSLGDDIRKADVTGKTFSLYGPPAGTDEPFFIEIS